MFNHRKIFCQFSMLCMLLLIVSSNAHAQHLTVFTTGPQIKVVDEDLKPILEVAPGMWGPGWKYQSFRGNYQDKGNRCVGSFGGKVRGTDVPFDFDVVLQVLDKRQFKITAKLQAVEDTELTMAVMAINIAKSIAGKQRLNLIRADGQRKIDLPLGRGDLGDGITQMQFADDQGNDYIIRFAEPARAGMDRQIRVSLAGGHLKTNVMYTVEMTVQLPFDAQFAMSPDAVTMPENWDDWFIWDASADMSQDSLLDMSSWLDKPAGKYGRVTRDKDQLIYNGNPTQFWGINICYSNTFPEHEVAQQKAKFYARYGINTVRFHKFADGSTWNGLLDPNSYVKFNPERCEKMDYLVNQFKEQGIFIKLSANFGRARLLKDDLSRVPYYKELGAVKRGVLDPGNGAIFLSRELQDIQIEQCTNFLKRTNQYTHMTYAQDPVVMVVELINEDSALFYGTFAALRRSPTLKERAGEVFGKWLRKRYGSVANLQKAWGNVLDCFEYEKVIGESWDGKIYPAGNPWFYDPDQLAGPMASRKQRLLDTMLFLYEIQNEFYDRFVKAIRDTGYEGQIVASNWQAGSAFSHFYNLHSDSRIGLIDRHNYFGGVGTMVSNPGSGSLSSGMQQVADRPFMLSEWIHTFPNEFGVEGPAIIGAYGMGLNGWNVSYMFHNGDNGRFRDRLGYKAWDVIAPQVYGIFPAVARQVIRGDVKQSDMVFSRNVHVPSMADGKLGFDDKVQQGYDDKVFSSKTVPAQTLAIGRSVIDFTDTFKPTPTVDISPFISGNKIRSSTGQLVWQTGEHVRDGYFTINTPGTQALVGFADGNTQQLDDASITTHTPFAAVYVSALNADGQINSDKQLLITAIARVRNTGMKYMAGQLIDKGKGPMRAEPVKATIKLNRSGGTLYALDQDGCRTDRSYPINNGQVQIDTARDKTFYYLIEY
ncbi:MAG: hypothetical protein CMJ19_07935 [Phycisphaeraceae bacterium]|nr:hypothetical protein [Phycisphaeraceae bacterium]